MEVYLDNAATTPLTSEVKNYIMSILDKVEDVVKHNEIIKTHTDELAASSNNIIKISKETVVLNEKNKEKVKQTKELMDGLITLADQMDEYTSSNALN